MHVLGPPSRSCAPSCANGQLKRSRRCQECMCSRALVTAVVVMAGASLAHGEARIDPTYQLNAAQGGVTQTGSMTSDEPTARQGTTTNDVPPRGSVAGLNVTVRGRAATAKPAARPD